MREYETQLEENLYRRIGKNICIVRHARRMTQEMLAFRIGSARNYIGCIERGEKRATLIVLKKIADVLDVELSLLLENC